MIAVVIPCYRVKNQILNVLKGIGPEVGKIFVIDDQCPENSGEFVKQNCTDPRVVVYQNPKNLGVGGAVMAGYRLAIEAGAKAIVKVDGDGQMDPKLISYFTKPLLDGSADYVKGNRFYGLEDVAEMPTIRLLGNVGLSFINKLVSGYWDIMDPTNGYTAIRGEVAAALPLDKISRDYFFESDMLFRLSSLKAVVRDLPMRASYADENSSLRIMRVLFSFPGRYLVRFLKRIFYNYFLRDFNFGSLTLVIGTILFGGGAGFSVYHIVNNWNSTQPAPSGVVMMAALPIILGFQSLIFFFQQDISSVPRHPIFSSLQILHMRRGQSERQ